ncbi:MAG: vanadium-dependent haloperoxidase [bacterium]
MPTPFRARTIIGIGTIAAVAGCASDVTPPSLQPPVAAVRDLRLSNAGFATFAAVLSGNAQMVAAAPTLVPPGAPLSPFVEARLYAIASVAMHDALNGVDDRYDRYADNTAVDSHANATAAVLTAAHDAIIGAAPASLASTNAWYASAMALLSRQEGIARGVAIGHRSAAAILALRNNDGTANGAVGPYHPGPAPGDYQFTFPFNTPGFDFFGTGGFADATLWGSTVTPFVLHSGAQFRAPPPYGVASNALAVQTRRYTADYREVKALGCATCSARSAEQTTIAQFWSENSPTGWNRIAKAVADRRNLDAWEGTRLLAVMAMAEFDSYVSSLEGKYHYNFWRPVTAVALAATDGNGETTTQAGWDVLVFPTPPIPDYPSAHATAGGAGAGVIDALFPGEGPSFSTTSTSLAGVTRTFRSASAAAAENALSRIYIGYHFRLATEAGLTQGRSVGAFVAANAPRPHSGREHDE